MKYWTGLHSDVDAAQLQQGADALLNLALGAGGNTGGSSSATVDTRRLTNQAADNMDTGA
jgi:ribonucleotide reductase alpha subunit